MPTTTDQPTIEWTPELEAARVALCEFWVQFIDDRMIGAKALETEQALTILGDIANRVAPAPPAAGAGAGEAVNLHDGHAREKAKNAPAAPDALPGRLTNPIAVAHLAKMISDAESGGAPVAGEVQYLPAHPLTFTYRNYRGEVSQRRVLPIRIHFGSTRCHSIPQYLLRALDLDKEEIRDFAWKDISPAPEGEG